MAFGEDKALELLCQPKKSAGAGTVYSYRYYKAKGQTSKTPVVGAQIFFTKNKAESGIHHTGLVYAFNPTHVFTIEGNSGNRVRRLKYLRSDPKIYGYGVPKYDANDPGLNADKSAVVEERIVRLASNKTTIPVRTSGAPSKNPIAKGTVTADVLNVRTNPGKDFPNLKSVPTLSSGDVVDVCDMAQASDGGKWYYIKTPKGTFGYASAKFIDIEGAAPTVEDGGGFSTR